MSAWLAFRTTCDALAERALLAPLYTDTAMKLHLVTCRALTHAFSGLLAVSHVRSESAEAWMQANMVPGSWEEISPQVTV